MSEKGLTYWFISFSILDHFGNTILSIEENDEYFPVGLITKFLQKKTGQKIVIMNYERTTKQAKMEFDASKL